jgi:Na+-driven multidrug efflux pump
MIFAGVSILYFTVSKQLIAMFTNEPAILSIARTPLRIYAACAVFLAPVMVLGGGLRGAGETRFPMLAMFSSRFFIRIPLCWLLSIKLGWGLTGVWIGMCFDFFLRSFVLILKFRQGKWKKIEI